jgi:hypothetical protein
MILLENELRNIMQVSPLDYLSDLINKVGVTRVLLDGPRSADRAVIDKLSSRQWSRTERGGCEVYIHNDKGTVLAFRPK